MRTPFSWLAGVALACTAAHAGVVYENTKDNPAEPETSYDGKLEFGDQITLSGTQRWISGFSFEYFADFTPTGDETARLRFYANDGGFGQNASQMPGTLLFDTGEFSLESGYKTAAVEGIGFEVPDTFTWTIEFSGMSETERAGLLIDENVNVGSSAGTFWENRQDGWREVALPGLTANFIAQLVVAPMVVPGSLQVENGVAALQVDAIPGRFYRLQYVNSLGQIWQTVTGSQVQAASETVVLQDPNAGSSSMRFYRVQEIPPA